MCSTDLLVGFVILQQPAAGLVIHMKTGLDRQPAELSTRARSDTVNHICKYARGRVGSSMAGFYWQYIVLLMEFFMWSCGIPVPCRSRPAPQPAASSLTARSTHRLCFTQNDADTREGSTERIRPK